MLDVEHTLPRLRRSQRPEEVLELRPPLALRGPDRREPGVAVERTDDALANVDLRAVSEPAPTLADRRQAFSQRAREHAVQVADGHVVEQPTLAIGERHVRACPWAVARRTKPGHLLVGAKHVPAAEQGEEVVRVILQRRQLSLPRELPREDRRDGVGRGVVHRGRPRVPRGVARETPKFGYRTVSSDPSALISELTGNSSKTTSTTGVWVATGTSRRPRRRRPAGPSRRSRAAR